MFSLPLMNALPLPGLFGGTVVVPEIGAFVASVVIAAFVGSGLGLLRQMTSPHRVPAARQPQPGQPAQLHPGDRPHQEAA